MPAHPPLLHPQSRFVSDVGVMPQHESPGLTAAVAEQVLQKRADSAVRLASELVTFVMTMFGSTKS
eukprot:SAG11_NODE_38400_length_252_cov_1.013072_1_plen_65_part_01